MALTAAERQRQYRERQKAHRAGDHSRCDPSRCDGDVAVTPVTSRPPRFAAAGARLWVDMDGEKASGATRALIVEACRISDRLAALDRLITGDARDWLEIVESRGDPERQELVINGPLAEARQQATAFKQIVAELRQSSAAKPAQPQPTGEGAGIVNLAARIAERRGQATG